MAPNWDYSPQNSTKHKRVQGRDSKEVNSGENISRMETFVLEPPNRSLDEIILPDPIREQIHSALNQIRFRDKLYNEWNLKKIDPSGSRTVINFFGPPGTGKSFAAEAIAHHLNKKIIKINYAEIESKYVGETPKNITAAFKKAKESDSILFFDEADSILGKRMTSVTQSADHGVNVSRSVMLLQLDKFDGVVLFATNLPKNYDGAFVRRILAHIEFVLPDPICREKLWKYLLPVEVPKDNDIDFSWLAEETDGLSGGDILNVVKLASGKAVARPEPQCLVQRNDITEAVYQVRNAKTKVGSGFGSNKKTKTTITEKEIDPDKLSPQEKEQLDHAVELLSQP